MSIITDDTGERLHALDAVRGVALILGVFFHATLSFMEPRIWLVADSDPSPAVTVAFFVLHVFRMTVFFMIAGFFARLTLERRGPLGFVADRARRIALPLVVLWPIVFASIIAVIIWSAIQANGGTPPTNAPPPAPLTAKTFPLTHLWFLYVLLFFYAGALALRGVAALVDPRGAMRERLDGVVRFLTANPLGLLLLAAPGATVLALKPDWTMWFGVPTPDTGLVPNSAAMTAYGVAFGFGWLLHRQADAMRTWIRSWPIHLAAGVGLTVACLTLAGATPKLVPSPMGWEKVAFAGAYVLAAWCWTFGLVGMALRFLNTPSPARRYLADASYWIYIVHLPVVMVLQTAVAPIPLPGELKYALISIATLAIALVTYQLMVRRSFVGAFLAGRRRPRPERAALVPIPGE